MSALRRVGHKGADLIAPGNTYASFDAARDAGVDMIEFDVLPAKAGRRLMLAHDYEDAAGRAPHTLEEGLDHLAGDAFAGIELDVDLKLPGYELEVLDALRDRDLLDRALISSQYRSSLAVHPRRRAARAARVVGAEGAPRSVQIKGARAPRAGCDVRAAGDPARCRPRVRSGPASAMR